MRFILIRHAQSAPNSSSHQSEWGLTAAGEHSCIELARFLKEQNTTALYSSHEHKSIKTAEFAASQLGITHSVWDGVQEQNNDGVGWFESADDFRAAVRKLFEQPTELVFGPETAAEAGQRMQAALAQLANTHLPEETVAIVSHGRVITSFLQQTTTIDPIDFWLSLTFPDCIIIEWPEIAIVGRKSFEFHP